MPRRPKLALIALLMPGLLALPGSSDARKKSRSLEARVKRLEAALSRVAPDVSAMRLPRQISFCGEKVPLDIEDVRERMEREFYLMLADRAQVVLWVKRARRMFPVVEKAARAQKTCADLKYVAVVESGLRPAVVSRAKAKGWWQFMAATGRQYGLRIDRLWDERADLEKSTDAGVRYLTNLYKKFGSWPMAMAAYNTGPGRLSKSSKAQGQQDYWRLDLLREAERYVPRIILSKVIFENLDAYGFHVDIDDGYAPEAVGYVKVKAREDGDLNLLEAARGSGISYRTLKRLNPRLVKDDLPGGRSVVVRVPRGEERPFRRWARGALGLPVGPEPAVKEDAPAPRSRRSASSALVRKAPSKRAASKRGRSHVVKSGESLWGIAKRYDVSIEDLRRWNQLKNTDILSPGQRIVVRR